MDSKEVKALWNGYASVMYNGKKYYLTKTNKRIHVNVSGAAPLNSKEVGCIWKCVRLIDGVPYCKEITNTKLGQKVYKSICEYEEATDMERFKTKTIADLRKRLGKIKDE